MDSSTRMRWLSRTKAGESNLTFGCFTRSSRFSGLGGKLLPVTDRPKLMEDGLVILNNYNVADRDLDFGQGLELSN